MTIFSETVVSELLTIKSLVLPRQYDRCILKENNPFGVDYSDNLEWLQYDRVETHLFIFF